MKTRALSLTFIAATLASGAAFAQSSSSSSSQDDSCVTFGQSSSSFSSSSSSSTIKCVNLHWTANPALRHVHQRTMENIQRQSNRRRGGGGVTRIAALDGEQETGAAASGQSRWSVWGSGAYTRNAFTFQPLDSSGRSSNGSVGGDYQFNNGVTLGAALSGDRTRINTKFNNGFTNTDGYTFAPYIAVPFGNNWLFDASLGVGKGDVDIRDNAVTGTTSDKRTFGSLQLSYATNIGQWQVTGKGGLISTSNRLRSFTLSNGLVAPASTNKADQLRIGAQASYAGAGQFVPYVGLTYMYDASRSTIAPVGGATPANDRDAFQLVGGLNYNGTGPVSGGLQFTSELSRKQVRNNALIGNLSVRF
jgi:hypothetical protein